jgi:hypothetical protein
MAMAANDCNSDEYGYDEWSSLEAAKKYYGSDFSYTALEEPEYHNGKWYTHYYTFSDGSRMYFGVRS